MSERYSIEEVKAMSDELLNEGSEEAGVLREYLTSRGLQPELMSRMNLGYYEDNGAWLMIPFEPDEETKTVPYYKLIGFDPKSGDWRANDNGGKIVRTSGSARLYPYPKMYLQEKAVLLCEGEIDALIARQCGANAFTTTAGASCFNRTFAQTISKATDTVYLAYDGDEAGREGRKKTGKILVQEGLTVKFCEVPSGMDVNDVYVKGGAEKVQSLIKQATEFEHEPQSTSGQGFEADIEKIFGFLDTQWEGLSDEEKERAVRGMQRVLAREGLSLSRVTQPE